MSFQITIIGMDQTGTSIGLALGNHKEKIVRVGHDRSPEKARQAKQQDAVDQVEMNLPDAVSKADLILLCEPLPETLETIDQIIPELNQGKYLFDLASGKQEINRKIGEVAPNFRHALNLHLTVNPEYLGKRISQPPEPQADYFKNGLMIVSTSAYTSAEAVDLANTLAGILKTEMLFCDPVELDGMLAGAVQFPPLLSAAMIQSTHRQSGWRETKKLTDIDYFAVSQPLETRGDPNVSVEELFHNRENLIYWVDAQIEELEKVKALLQSEDDQSFAEWWQSAQQNRSQLIEQRNSANWDGSKKPFAEIPSSKERFARLFTFGNRNTP